MRSSIAERALGIVLLGLVLVGNGCRDDKPAPAAPGIGTGGAGGKATGGRGGSGGKGGSGGTNAGAGGSMSMSGGTSGGDAADAIASEGGTDVAGDAVATDTPPSDAVVIPEVGGDAQSVVMRSFYAHPTYPAGVIRPGKTPVISQSQLDASVASFHRAWKTKFVATGCGGAYIKAGADFGPGLATVSELHGYGMIIAVIMGGADDGARATFDNLFKFARMWKSPVNQALMAHEIQLMGSTCRVPVGMSSQTDGDMDVALALLMADKQWGSAGAINYLQEARNMIAAIKQSELNPSTKLPLLGDWVVASDTKFYTGARTSDLMGDHLRAFGAAQTTPDPFWMQSVDAVYNTISKIQMTSAVTTGLLPDFVVNLNATPVPAPAHWSLPNNSPNDGQYSYHAARVPLRLVADYLASAGTEVRSKAALAKLNEWVKTKTGGNPATIVDGYRIDNGQALGDTGPNWVFEGPFGAAAIIEEANQAWLDAIWGRISAGDPGNDVNAETIRLLSMLVMSGHWWAP